MMKSLGTKIMVFRFSNRTLEPVFRYGVWSEDYDIRHRIVSKRDMWMNEPLLKLMQAGLVNYNISLNFRSLIDL